MFFNEVVFADDLNAYRGFPSTTSDEVIDKCISSCQQELHSWGRANRVSFDASKESRHIMSLTNPAGETFRLLGIVFDGALEMADAVNEVVALNCVTGRRVEGKDDTPEDHCSNHFVVASKSSACCN